MGFIVLSGFNCPFERMLHYVKHMSRLLFYALRVNRGGEVYTLRGRTPLMAPTSMLLVRGVALRP